MARQQGRKTRQSPTAAARRALSVATISTLLTITLAVIRAAAFAHACSARIAIAFQPAPVPPAIAIPLSRRSTGVALWGGRLPALLRCFATLGTVAIEIALIAAQILPRFAARCDVFSNVALVATKIGAITSQVLAFGGRARLVALPQILSELALVLSYVRAIGGDIALVPANVSRVLPDIATVLTNISAILANVLPALRRLCVSGGGNRERCGTRGQKDDSSHHDCSLA